MSTHSELLIHRDTAGARYAAAVAELRAATIDLAAIESVLVNMNAGRMSLQTFAGFPSGVTLRHAKYAPNVGDIWSEDIAAAGAPKLAAYGMPDPE